MTKHSAVPHLRERSLSALDAIFARRSVRAYTDQPLEDATIRALLDAAVRATTAMHAEPWVFAVIQDRNVLRKISDRPFAAADCWLAAANLMLAACALGLGTCCIGSAVAALNSPDTKAELNLPDDLELVAPIIVGVPREPAAPASRKDPDIALWVRSTSTSSGSRNAVDLSDRRLLFRHDAPLAIATDPDR
jgi:nitroreductase